MSALQYYALIGLLALAGAAPSGYLYYRGVKMLSKVERKLESDAQLPAAIRENTAAINRAAAALEGKR